MEKNAKIYVAGHHGLVGSAIWKNLQNKGYTNLVGRTHKELDLLDSVSVRQFFDEEQPEKSIPARTIHPINKLTYLFIYNHLKKKEVHKDSEPLPIILFKSLNTRLENIFQSNLSMPARWYILIFNHLTRITELIGRNTISNLGCQRSQVISGRSLVI